MEASSLEEMGLYQCNLKSTQIKEQFGILGNQLICSWSDEKTSLLYLSIRYWATVSSQFATHGLLL